jgi:ParB family transcriptional regulator, chromosome partitioning protein
MDTTNSNKSKKKKALGRGLGALLSDSDVGVQEDKAKEFSSVSEIPLENIEVNPFQPRTNFDQEQLHDLADSIRTQGIIQPITVRSLGSDSFQLIAGERRVQASKIAGLDTIPAFVRKANDQQMLEMALIENIQRENLNPIEISLSYQRLITECSLKQDELGERVGKNRSTVNNYLRLLKLPPNIQIALRDKRITMGHARALINMEDVDKQLHIFNAILKDDLSVRKVEAMVRDFVTGAAAGKEKPKAEETSPEIKQLQNQLSSHFGTRVQVKNNQKEKGEIRIPFVSTDDLNRILELLNM